MSDCSPAVTRRALLAGACAGLALGVAATTALPAAADANVRQLPDGRLAVRVRRIPELGRVGGAVRVGTIDARPIAVVRIASGYRAISLVCPHQGATVVKDADGWVCPAHGSEFTPTGSLVLGPATRDLPAVRSVLNKGVLTVG
jgi:cytochrome b6-f complex iron-sulfur subunit